MKKEESRMKKLAWGALFIGLFAACGGGGEKKDIMLTDGGPDVMGVCSPLTQAGCAAGEKCAWIEDQEDPPLGHIGCAPDGTIAVGGACTQGPAGPMGYSNCAKGSECIAGTCKTICDHQGGAPMCDMNHACGRYEGLFESGDTTVAGVCDPKCDPLTQRLLTNNAEACGSPNAAMPNAGCFTFDGVDYTCAPVGPSTLPLTDGMPARGPASGGAYVNGCSPGYLPFFRQMTGSNTIVCAGMCAPLKTDNTAANINNVTGSNLVPAKLPLEAAPAAGKAQCVTNQKGSRSGTPINQAQNCLFMWPFNVDMGMLPVTPYNDNLGICFNQAGGPYTYDHDANANTPPRPVPGCQALPPKTPVPADCTCDPQMGCSGTGCPDGLADEWGCYNTVDSGITTFDQPTKAPFVKSFLKDFKVGGRGEGRGVRHRIVQ
jgi:hypothetical protein